jgi:hypothetical protein
VVQQAPALFRREGVEVIEVPTEAHLGPRRQSGERLVALQRLLLLGRRERSHAEKNSLPHSFAAGTPSLLKDGGAALGGLSIELGQTLPQPLLCGGRQALEKRILRERTRLLLGRQDGDAQEKFPQRGFPLGAAPVAHFLSRTAMVGRGARRRRLLRRQRSTQREEE